MKTFSPLNSVVTNTAMLVVILRVMARIESKETGKSEDQIKEEYSQQIEDLETFWGTDRARPD